MAAGRLEWTDKQIETRDGLTLRGREWPQRAGARHDCHRSRPRRARRPLRARRGASSTRAAGASSATTTAATARATARAAGSPPATTCSSTWRAVVDAVRAEHPGGPLVLLGHSLGGLVAARFVAGAPGARGRLVAAGRRAAAVVAGARPRHEAAAEGDARGARAADAEPRRRQRPEAGVDLARPGGGRGLPGRSAGARPDRAAAGALHRRRRRVRARASRRAGRVPTLLLYAGADRCVPPAGSAAFAAAAPPAVVTARVYPRAVPRDHERTRAGRGVIGLRRGAGYTDRFAHEEPDDERTRPPASAPGRRGRAARQLRRARLGRRDRSGAHRLHRRPGQEPDVRRRVERARLHRPGGARRRGLGREAATSPA